MLWLTCKPPVYNVKFRTLLFFFVFPHYMISFGLKQGFLWFLNDVSIYNDNKITAFEVAQTLTWISDVLKKMSLTSLLLTGPHMYLYIVISKINSVVDKNIRKEITCTKNFNIFTFTLTLMLTLTLTPGVSL